MKILYITFSPLKNNAGHTARLKLILKEISAENKVSVLCLKENENKETKAYFEKVNFFHKKIIFNGWTVVNSKQLSEDIYIFCIKEKIDIVIMCMEVWDLMRDLSNKFDNKITFSTILNAMPFLISPLNPSGFFEKDVKKFVQEDIPLYRKNYIKNHYLETVDVFKKINIISHNDTVEYYIKSYFPKIKTFKLPKMFLSDSREHVMHKKIKYDLLYMARIEKGKGIEYLEDILISLSKKLKRKVSLLILGRVDDLYSKSILDSLLQKNLKNDHFFIDFKGWVDEKQKKKYLPMSNIFIYPSVLDSLAVVINEAVSFGLPVVTWNSNFYNMNYKKQKFIIPSKLFNTEDFVENIKYAMNKKSYLSSNILKYLNNLENKKTVISKELDLYSKIIKYAKNK